MAPAAFAGADDLDVDDDEASNARRVDDLVAAHYPALRAYVRMHLPAKLRAHESCCDVVQSVCREVLNHEEQFEDRGDAAFRGWLFAHAKHKIQDRLRFWARDRRQPSHEEVLAHGMDELAEVYDSIGSPSRAAIRSEELEKMELAFERLSEEDREIIGLCRFAGMTSDQAGQHLGGRSSTAVRSHLSRALVRLTTEMERLGIE